MTWTKHGHYIPDSAIVVEEKRPPIARCGGPKHCVACETDVNDHNKEKN